MDIAAPAARAHSSPRLARVAPLFAWCAVAIAAASGAAEVLSGLGYRWGWWSLSTGLQTMRWSTSSALFAAVLALAALLIAIPTRRALVSASVGLLLALAVAAPPVYLWRQAQVLPHIHDITTDTEHPPQFVAVLPLRAGARNSTDYSAQTAALQKQGYPDLGPALLDVPAQEAMRRAESAARAMGWQIVADDPDALRIEATATTSLFAFKDDVVIRITAQGSGGSRVDVRSLSRVGGSDFGANAKRIRAFMQRLAA